VDRESPRVEFPHLQTERLVLQQITPEDTEALFRLFASEEVARYLDFVALKQIEEAEEIVAWCKAIWEQGKGIRWGIVGKDGGELMGTCGYHNWARGEFRAEIGYDLMPRFWGQGLMKEALVAMLEYGFAEMDLHRVQAMVAPMNERSQRLLNRLGFVREGILRGWRFYKGKFWDEVCYSLLRHEWRFQL